jgi:hypothetical protein
MLNPATLLQAVGEPFGTVPELFEKKQLIPAL